jgi:hypothetical protein
MSLQAPIPEARMPKEPLSRMADMIFDDRPVALRGSMQVVIAMMIGLMVGNSLHMML